MPDQSDQQQDGQTAQISGTVQIKQNAGERQPPVDSHKQEEDDAPEKNPAASLLSLR
ncbi:hypothetical protein [Tunturiibacter gelidiferens]|uniref:hypothetical protein n=1 Tax=Tunturiibacter gelidiferens TaxID=3069689 RepID=UPI003D9B416E